MSDEKSELQSENEIINGPHCPACDSKEWQACPGSEDKVCAQCGLSMADSMEFPPLSAGVAQTPPDRVSGVSRIERLVFALISSPWIKLASYEEPSIFVIDTARFIEIKLRELENE